MTLTLNLPLPPFLHITDEEIRFTGTRIGLFHFVFDYNHGHTAEALYADYPHIPLATIHKAIAFYLENKAEVDRFAAEYQAELDRLRATGRHVNRAELQARLAAKKAALGLPTTTTPN